MNTSHNPHCFSLRSRFLAVAVTLALASAALADDHAGWIALFNGRTLDGWVQRGGEAKYRVEDGCIVGQTVANTPNAFLCTTSDYGDFVLEFEFKVPADMNSGVQFRSGVYDKDTQVTIAGSPKQMPAGRVHGYQYEIDPSPRAFTGGVYDEARRGWLANLKDNPAAQKAFKADGWNKGRIECRGDHIQTWINGVKATDFRDAMTLRGLIALQVHSIAKDKPPGSEIRWRNIRLKKL